MSLIRLCIAGYGFLNIIVGARFGLRDRPRLADRRLQWGAAAMVSFGLAIVLLSTINIDGWSITDWILGVCTALVLFGAGLTAGRFVEALDQPRRASNKAQPPVAPNGAQA